jgi:Prokaryotic Cytochrome C oxidase subunit IV
MIPVDRTLSLAWLGLVALTVLSFAAAEGLVGHRLALAGIFAIAAIKGQVLASRFMEVGHALPHWRALYRVWIVAVAILLAAGHLL